MSAAPIRDDDPHWKVEQDERDFAHAAAAISATAWHEARVIVDIALRPNLDGPTYEGLPRVQAMPPAIIVTAADLHDLDLARTYLRDFLALDDL